MNVIVGIDPGTIRMGWCIIRSSRILPSGVHTSPLFVDAGTVEVSKNRARVDRVAVMYHELRKVIGKAHTELEILKDDAGGLEVAIEKAYVRARRYGAVVPLGEARGAAISAAASYGAKIFEYAPSEARKLAVLKGNASKEYVHRSVQSFMSSVPTRVLPSSLGYDATDAACLALARARDV